jgi:hypothetical protein
MKPVCRARSIRPWALLCLGWIIAFLVLPAPGHGQHSIPILLYDEAHHNHPSAGPINALLDIARSAGVEVRIGRRPLDEELTSRPQVLIVSGAMPVPRDDFFARFSGAPGAAMAAYWMDDRMVFSDVEVRAVVDWIMAGGSLLLIIDHAPQGAAAGNLVRGLGADVRNGFTWDGLFLPPGYVAGDGTRAGRTSNILFSRETGRIGDHPITAGSSDRTKVNAVATYVGTSIQGPLGSTPLWVLSDSATDYFRPWPDGPEYRISAAGRSQAVAYELGEGRVVIVGEAGALMQDPFGNEPPADPAHPGIGLDYVHADNRVFAENLISWLLRRSN